MKKISRGKKKEVKQGARHLLSSVTFTETERQKILYLLQNKYSIRKIARKIKRQYNEVSCEILRITKLRIASRSEKYWEEVRERTATAWEIEDFPYHKYGIWK